MTDKSELKPCPFCGEIPQYDQIGGYPFVHRIKCRNELCGVQPESQSGILQVCENNWNTRTYQEDAYSNGYNEGYAQAKYELNNPSTFDMGETNE